LIFEHPKGKQFIRKITGKKIPEAEILLIYEIMYSNNKFPFPCLFRNLEKGLKKNINFLFNK